MKKAFAALLVALLCCTFAVTAVGCSETQTAAPSLALLNESAVAYSEGGTQFSLDVRSEGLQGTITYDVIPQMDGITVDESGTVRIAAEVADGTVFTVRARSGDTAAQITFTYGTVPAADESGVSVRFVKESANDVTVQLPAAFGSALAEVYDNYGNKLPSYRYTLNGTRLTVGGSYLATLGGQSFLTVKAGENTFRINLEVFDKTVSTVEEFLAIGQDTASLARSYLLTADLDFYEYCQSNAMPQIGSYSDSGTSALTGTIDGNGHVLRNITISYGGDGGLFGHIAANGVVRNLGIADSSFTCTGNFGGTFAGYVKGTIENCFVRSSTLHGNLASGFMGKEDTAKRIANCYTEITADGSIAGAFAYYCKTEMQNCFASVTTSTPFTADERNGDVSTCAVLDAAGMRAASTWAAYPTDVFRIEEGSLPAFAEGGEGTQTQLTILSSETQSGSFRVAVGFDRGYAPVTFSLTTDTAGVSIDPVTGVVTVTAAAGTSFTVRAACGALTTEKTFTVAAA